MIEFFCAGIFTGNVAVGNLSKMLPFVLHEIEKQPKRQYLLLHSLKEARCSFGQICLYALFNNNCIMLCYQL